MTGTQSSSGVQGQGISLAASRAGDSRSSISRWWRLAGAVSMNLALGTLYAWSVFVAPLEGEFGWKRAQTSTVFTVAVVVFAASLLIGGRLQDRFGPFWVAFSGSILITFSFFLFAHTSSLHSLYFFYGVLGGIGNGFGYGTTVPTMAKWFPERTGLAIGIALGGYGGGSAIFGTFANLVLFPHFGWRPSCEILGGIFFVMTMAGALLMKNPEAAPRTSVQDPSIHIISARYHFAPREVLASPAFYLLWIGFGLGSTAGLMVISQLIPFARSQGIASASIATFSLVIGAFGNVSGRILSGWTSDLLGRLNTLRVVLLVAGIAMPVLYWVGTQIVLVYFMIFVVYFCYGTQASVNPATIADFWGTRHAGTNYGMLFTAWGFAGILGPTIGGVLFDKYKNYAAAFYTAAALAGIAFLCVMLARRPGLPPAAAS